MFYVITSHWFGHAVTEIQTGKHISNHKLWFMAKIKVVCLTIVKLATIFIDEGVML